MKLLYIEWVDSHCIQGWIDIDQVIDFMKNSAKTIKSTGYLVVEDDDFICLTTSNGDDIFCDPIVIPKCAIKRKRFLKT